MSKISELTSMITVDNANDVLPIVDNSDTTTKKVTPNVLFGNGLANLIGESFARNATLNDIAHFSVDVFDKNSQENTPSGANAGIMFTFITYVGSYEWRFQLALSTSGDRLFVRSKMHGQSYSEWKGVTLTVQE